MGIPVVSGVADLDTRGRMLRDFTVLPFVNASRETLEQQVEGLIVNAKMREAWGRAGRHHLDRFHTPQAVVGHMLHFAEPVMA